MAEQLRVGPDVTFAVDGEGVIRARSPPKRSQARCSTSGAVCGGRTPFLRNWPGQIAQSVEEARRDGESSCFTVNQRFPSGREVLLEYTTVNLGKKAGFIAIGKSLQAISELQSRLELVQQEREQDYWKLREIETRYRALLDASSEAVPLFG